MPIPEDVTVTADYVLYLGGALGVGDLGRHGELLGDELGGDLVHGVHGDGQAVGLLRVQAREVVPEQGRRLAGQGHQHVLQVGKLYPVSTVLVMVSKVDFTLEQALFYHNPQCDSP